MYSLIKYKSHFDNKTLFLVYPSILLPFVLLSSRFELVDKFDTKEEAEFNASLLEV